MQKGLKANLKLQVLEGKLKLAEWEVNIGVPGAVERRDALMKEYESERTSPRQPIAVDPDGD